MRVRFFTAPRYIPDSRRPVVDVEFRLNLVPVVGDLVSFDEGHHEYPVKTRLIEIDDHGDEVVLIELER